MNLPESKTKTNKSLARLVNVADGKTNDIFSYFSQKISLKFHANCLFIKSYFIRKTHLYNFDPLKPHFYTVKLEFTGVYIIFLISAQKHTLWVLVRTTFVLNRNMKNIRIFLSENFHFLAVKFSVYLNRHVSEMF